MSEVSTVYDALITRIEAVLTGHYRLSNPYKLEENPSTFLRIGYGLGIGSATNTGRPMSGCISIQRTFQVSITRRYAALETNASAKATTEKQILEDMFLLIKDFHENTSLTNGNRVVKFDSDNGINYVETESDRFMYTTGLISIEYFENLT
jgi:hypothetical protein